MKNPIVKTNNIITQKELENGLWSFILDHAKCVEKDMWFVKFGITTKEDFLRRMYARATGLYSIKDNKDILKEVEKKIITQKIQKRLQEQNDLRQQQIAQLPKYQFKILLLLRRTANILEKRWLNKK